MDPAYLRANPKMRAQAVNEAFADPDIKAIFTSTGGDDSVRLLPYLNQQLIAANPKILMGFSDITTLHVLANLQGLITFYGPCIMAGLAQIPSLPISFKTHLQTMLFEPQASYEYQPYHDYCEGYPDWANLEHAGQINPLKPNDGWHWLQGSGKTQGELFGGCVEVLDMIKATDFWPLPNFWQNKILFLETSEEKPPLHYIDRVLRNYGMMGLFDSINGLIVGRARDYSDEEKQQLESIIVSVVANEFNQPTLPIISNFDIGHTDPQLVLPMGVNAEIDCHNKQVKLIESWLI